MNKVLIIYLVINVIFYAINFYALKNLFNFNESDLLYAHNIYSIIGIVSAFVFSGIFVFLRVKMKNILFAYIFLTFIKNIILVFCAIKYKETLKEMIFYAMFIYLALMFLEIFFILKIKKESEIREIE